MRSNFRKKWDDMDLRIESSYRKYSYRKSAKTRLKRMNGGFDCQKEYKEIVLPFWEKYGYRPAEYWYKIFSDREKKVDPRYIPDDLYYGEILPYFSNPQFRRFGEDKCYHDVWFSDIKRPETICKNIAGVYYDAEMCPIDREKAIALVLETRGEYLIKPSIDSGEGRLIRFFSSETTERKNVEEAIDSMKANFIFQKVVKQHPVLAQMNPSSLNTIRVVSFFFEGEVHILSGNFRVGAPDAKVDNVGAGGFACQIFEDGHLSRKAVNRKAQWVEESHTGIKFADIRIPSYDRILEIIRKKHSKLAHFKLIGWDFSVDETGEPVFIEYNVCPGTNQITCGPTFGDLTERVLDEFFLKRTLAYAQN